MAKRRDDQDPSRPQNPDDILPPDHGKAEPPKEAGSGGPKTPRQPFPNLSLDAPADEDIIELTPDDLAEPLSATRRADDITEAPSEVLEAATAPPSTDIDPTEHVLDALPADEDLKAPSSVVKAQPASDVFAADFLKDDPSGARPPSSVVQADIVVDEDDEEPIAEAQPASDVFAEEFSKKVPSGPPSSAVEAEVVDDDEESIVEAQPASDVFAAEFSKKDPSRPPSSVVQAEVVVDDDDEESIVEVQPASEVLAGDLLKGDSSAARPPSSAVEVEAVVDEDDEPIAEAEAASDIYAADVKDQPATKDPSSVIEAQPASDIFATEFGDIGAGKAPSSVVEAVEVDDVEEIAEAQPASAVFAAEFAEAPSSPDKEASSVIAAEVIEAEEAESVAEEPVAEEGPLHKAPRPGTAVHPEAQAPPSSAIVPMMEETVEVSGATAAQDDRHKVQPTSGVIPLVEAAAAQPVLAGEDASSEETSSSVLGPAEALAMEASGAEPSSAAEIIEAEAEEDDSVLSSEGPSAANIFGQDHGQSHVFADFSSEASPVKDDAGQPKSASDIQAGASSIFAFAEEDDDDFVADPPSGGSSVSQKAPATAEDADVLAAELQADPPSSVEPGSRSGAQTVLSAGAQAAPSSDVEKDLPFVDDALVELAAAKDAGSSARKVTEDEEIVEAAPVSDVIEAEEVAEAQPASAVIEAEEAEEAEAISAIAEADAVIDTPPESDIIAEIDAASDVFQADEPQEATEVLDDEPGAVEPISELAQAAEVAEVPADSDIIAEIEAASALEAEAEEVAEAEEAEEVAEAEEVEEAEAVAEAEEIEAEAVEAEEAEEEPAPRKAKGHAKKSVKDPSVEWEELPSADAGSSDDGVDWSTGAAAALAKEGLAEEDVEEAEVEEAEVEEEAEEVGEEVEDATLAYDVADKSAPGMRTEAISGLSIDDADEVSLDADRPSGIDRLAEALESGTDLRKKKATPKKVQADDAEEVVEAEAEVEADEAVAEEEVVAEDDIDFSEVPSGASKGASLFDDDVEIGAAMDDDEEVVAAAEDEDEEVVAAAAEDDEEVVAAAEDDEEPTPAPKKKGKAAKVAAKAAVADDEEEVAEEAAEEEEAPAPVRKKGRKAAVAADDDDEGGGTAVLTRGPKPKYGRRWMGGMLVGWLLLGGAGAGLYYGAPDLLQQGVDEAQKLVEQAPGVTKKPPPGAEQQAALKKQLDQANKSLEEAKEQQAEKEKKLLDEMKPLKEADKTAKLVLDLLIKNDILEAEADAKTLTKALAAALKSKKVAETKVDSVAGSLVTNELIDKKEDFDVAEFGKLVKALAGNKAAMEKINEALANAKLKEKGVKGVDELLTARKDLKKDLDDVAGKLDDVNKLLADAKVKDDGAKGVKDLLTDRASLATTLNTLFKELMDAGVVQADGDPRKEVVGGLKQIRLKADNPLAMPLNYLAGTLGSFGSGTARLLEKGLEKTTLLAELAYYHAREPLIQNPSQKVDVVLSQLQNKIDPDLVKGAMREADYLLSEEAKSNQQTRAKAHYVNGLGYRQQHKFDEARKSFEEAIKEAGGVKSAWLAQVQKALGELTDARVYFTPRIDQLRLEGNWKAAQEELAVALKALPGDSRLLTRRGFVRLELARADGKIPKGTQQAIRDDAEVALKDAQAAGDAAFLLAMLEEDLGNFNKAEDMYRQALKSFKGSPLETTRIRVALGRLLQRERPPGIQQPPAAEPEPKKKDEPKDKKAEVGYVHPLTPLALALVIGAQPGLDEDEDMAAAARLKESIAIAKELMQSDDPKIKGQGYMLLGQAYAKVGRRTEGLRDYIEGLKLLFPGRETRELSKMVEEHPLFQQPDSLARPNPDLAEHHYGQGLQFYWAKNYPEAEAHFREAAKFFDQDARYFYFLGLAQYLQKTQLKRDAADLSFSRGARLEAQNRPAFATINLALERVQGPLRLFLNRYRTGGVMTSRD